MLVISLFPFPETAVPVHRTYGAEARADEEDIVFRNRHSCFASSEPGWVMDEEWAPPKKRYSIEVWMILCPYC